MSPGVVSCTVAYFMTTELGYSVPLNDWLSFHRVRILSVLHQMQHVRASHDAGDEVPAQVGQPNDLAQLARQHASEQQEADSRDGRACARFREHAAFRHHHAEDQRE